MKINTHEALDLTNKTIGLGAISRDEEGRILGAALKWWNLPILVNVVEVTTLPLGAWLPRDLMVSS